MSYLSYAYTTPGYVTGAIISTAMFVYLLSLPNKTRATWYLAIHILMSINLTFGTFLHTSIYDRGAIYAPVLIETYTAFGNIFLLQFIYNFPRNTHPVESRIVLVVTTVVGIAAYSAFIINTLNSDIVYNFDAQMFQVADNEEASRPTGANVFITFVWALILIARKTIAFSPYSGRLTPWLESRGGALAFIKRNLAAVPAGILRFFRTRAKEARSLRSFSLAILFNFVLALSFVLFLTGLLSWANFILFLTSGFTIQYFLYSVIYLNNSSQPTTFMVKLVGISLVSTLLTLGFVSRVTAEYNEQKYDQQHLAQITLVRLAVREGRREILPADIVYIAHRPLNEGAYAQEYSPWHRREATFDFGRLGTDDERLKAREIAALKKTPGPGLSELEARSRIRSLDARSALLTKDGQPRRLYRSFQPDNPKTFYVRYSFLEGNRVYEVGYDYNEYARTVHDTARTMIFFILGTAAALLLIFPLFFRAGLLEPLGQLLGGVTRVNAGDLDVRVPVKTQDEIGFLARSFNAMVLSIRDARAKLRDYADHLEEMVEDRTRQLRVSKKEIDDIMGHVRQGLLTINRDGRINPEYSARVRRIFGRDNLGGVYFPDLFTDPRIKKSLENYVDALFSSPMMDERMVQKANPIALHHYAPNGRGGAHTRMLEFSFSRIFVGEDAGSTSEDRTMSFGDNGEHKEVEKLMLVVADKTQEYELSRELERREQEHAARVERLYQVIRMDPETFKSFVEESMDVLKSFQGDIRELGTDPFKNRELIEKCYRTVHALKGNARALNLDSVSRTAHLLEEKLTPLMDNPERKTEELKELILTQSDQLFSEIQDGESLFQNLINMREAFQATRTNPLTEFQNTMSQVVLKETEALDRYADFHFDSNVDGTISARILREMRNPVMQMLRNAIDHGIEEGGQRLSRGKPEKGTVSLKLEHQGSILLIVCEDDGNGLDTELIKEKALEKNFITREQGEKMEESDVHRLIFLSGLSTAPRITETSGRGVGMDIVKETLRNLGAAIQIDTEAGKYTRFTIKIYL